MRRIALTIGRALDVPIRLSIEGAAETVGCLSSASADASHPLVVGVGPRRFLVAWTERSGESPLVLKTMAFAGEDGSY